MDISKKAINGFIWMWVILYASGFVIFGLFFLYDALKITLGYPSIIRGH